MYTIDQERKIKYLLRRLSELKNGHTLSAQFTDGYPFITYINRHGKVTKSTIELDNDNIYQYLNTNKQILSNVDLIEIAWQHYLTYGTPNGDLFKRNSLFDSINSRKGLTLIHQTINLDEIIQSKLLYPSGGCLGASIYCVPLRTDGRLHNLAKFIHDYELPLTIQSHGGKDAKISTLAIHIEDENFIHSNEEANGLDYLLMGKLQFEVYEYFKTKCNLPLELFNTIEKNIILKINKAHKFFDICAEYELDNIDKNTFIKQFEESMQDISILGYIYFEVLVEYITLFQSDDMTLILKELGEINNLHYKKLVFDLCPSLAKSFKLSDFNPKVKSVIEYLKEKSSSRGIFSYFDENHFLDFFVWRVAQYVRYKVLDTNRMPGEITFENIASSNPSLLGHLLHREIRVNKKLNEATSLYDKKRAELIWKVWNQENVLYPYNSIIPKGEVGLNPIYKNLDYKIFEVDIDHKTTEVRFKNQLDIELAFELVDKKRSTMRDPNFISKVA